MHACYISRGHAKEIRALPAARLTHLACRLMHCCIFTVLPHTLSPSSFHCAASLLHAATPICCTPLVPLCCTVASCSHPHLWHPPHMYRCSRISAFVRSLRP